MPQDSGQEWYADGLRFTCTQCGNCCTGPTGFVWFTEQEAAAIAAHLNIGLKAFYRTYTHAIGSKVSLNEVRSEHGYDCVFLRRDHEGKALCSIYPVRPKQCQTWPFWPDNLSSRRTWVQTSRRCPGMAAGERGEGKFYPIEQIRIIRDSNND